MESINDKSSVANVNEVANTHLAFNLTTDFAEKRIR